MVLAAVFVIISIGLVLNTSLGTLSSFGWQAVATICPLGALEGMLATKSVFPRALIALSIMIVATILFGKVFCSWVCTIHPITRFFDRLFVKLRSRHQGLKTEYEQSSQVYGADADYPGLAIRKARESSQVCGSANGCASCSEKRAKLDSRHLVLAGSLLSAAIFGFPVFCLICPIGLIFGTIIIIWQWIGFNNVSLSLLGYPAVLILELVVLRKWCTKFCPLGALLSLLSIPNRFLRPKVDASKCLREGGASCQTCAEVCPEGLDPHILDDMNECSKCAICKDECPANAITIPLIK
jgi:ferredoxin-type protein NapH